MNTSKSSDSTLMSRKKSHNSSLRRTPDRRPGQAPESITSRWTSSRHQTATSPLFSSSIPSIRPCQSTTTWPFPCARRCGGCPRMRSTSVCGRQPGNCALNTSSSVPLPISPEVSRAVWPLPEQSSATRRTIRQPTSSARLRIDLEKVRETLQRAKEKEIQTTYAYIVGIDKLETMEKEAERLMDTITRFPIVNIYQVQTLGQIRVMAPFAKTLEYYLHSRKIFERIFEGTDFKPRRWENYRPLWYDLFKGQPLTDS